MSNYWELRELKERVRMFNLTQQDIERLLRKEYIRTYKFIYREFEALVAEMGNTPTANQLYQSDKYFKLLNAIRQKLDDLGLFENNTLMAKFGTFYVSTMGKAYEGILLPNSQTVIDAISQAWVGDGMNFSDRIWKNKRLLIEKLNQGLINTVTTGQNWATWSKEIKSTFNTAFVEAKRLVVTELSHIQSKATLDKYANEGITQVRWIAEPDCCSACNAHKDQIYNITNVPLIPEHPNCRCTYIAVVTVNGIPLNTISQET